MNNYIIFLKIDSFTYHFTELSKHIKNHKGLRLGRIGTRSDQCLPIKLLHHLME